MIFFGMTKKNLLTGGYIGWRALETGNDRQLLGRFRQDLDLLPITGQGVLLGVVKIARLVKKRFKFGPGAMKPNLYIV